jgi:hypothetical protein
MAKSIPKTHLLSEDEWRSIGVQQSKGWVHYMIHEPGKFLQFTVYILMTLNMLTVVVMYNVIQ